jgi:hypothetical protein
MSDSEEDKKKKKSKPLKINGKLPDSIIRIKNVDKVFHEKWEQGRNLCDFPHPFRAVILGQVGMGKSTLAKNIFLRSQAGKYPFQELIVIHGSSETKEWDEMEPTMILNSIPEPDDLVINNKKACIIIDDFEFAKLPKQQLSNLSSLFRFVSSHHNFSIILCYQSFFDVPTIIKKCANIFIIYRPNDLDELTTIGRRVGLKKEVIIEVFNTIMNDKRDTLLVDMTEDSPCKYRKNLFIPLKIQTENDKLI